MNRRRFFGILLAPLVAAVTPTTTPSSNFSAAKFVPGFTKNANAVSFSRNPKWFKITHYVALGFNQAKAAAEAKTAIDTSV